ncbi:uncharacterized protein TOL2_C42130 [Desulfobacula toluolica Tol2]|uniref:Uncharacterized protein n=1 Tax=Desulfobacula toluolica (strain DSM 7467 / Tol2) TaxID=651182 RepID=K0NCT0_DESTT|nr:uncharacterized protein TOL2_C42130 [Desulfobacula toluolica Tol2]
MEVFSFHAGIGSKFIYESKKIYNRHFYLIFKSLPRSDLAILYKNLLTLVCPQKKLKVSVWLFKDFHRKFIKNLDIKQNSDRL